MKSKVLQRPMFMSDDEVDNVGIMQGFMDDLGSIFEEENEGDDEDYETGKMMGRTPDSPEIIMNNLRGDMRSVDARVEELADMVGYRAASATPMEVIALLQPVLAGQGAAQGIASLPMGAPEQAMPPMPSAPMAAPAPPSPEMPAGGIASLPEGTSAPMQMAKGGIVQHFQVGSTEDGVTRLPMMPSSSSTTVTQRLRDASENEVLNLLQQKPAQLPDLKASMEERIPLYQSILGTGDKDAMRASMLFDIAQAALGYAGNVSPQGQPLRGSPVARFGAAFSAVPGQIGTRLAAQQEQEQAVRLAALQAAEKDVQSVREANADLLKEQRSLMSTLSTTNQSDLLFGRQGLEARALGIATQYAADYAAGNTTPEEDAYFESSVSALQQARPVTDPITGQLTYVPQPLPPVIADAVRKRGRMSVDTPVLGAAATGPDEFQLPVLERNPLTVQPASEAYAEANMPSLYNAAGAQGPVPALKTAIFRFPVLNALATSDAGSLTESRQFIESVKNGLTSGFQAGTDRFTNNERQNLIADLNIAANVIDQPEAFTRRLFALDDRLQGIQQAALSTYRNMNLSVEERKNAQQKLSDVHEIRAVIGVPLHVSSPLDPRARDIVARYPVGTRFFITTGPNGQTVERTITAEMKGAL